jgi:Phospholipid-translocating P-type ATPase C-terminal
MVVAQTDFIPYFIFADNTSISVTGHDSSGAVDFGTTVAAGAVIAANLFTGLHIRYWTWMVTVVIVFSCLSLYAWVAIYSLFPYTFSGIVDSLFATLSFWVRSLSRRGAISYRESLTDVFWSAHLCLFAGIDRIGPSARDRSTSGGNIRECGHVAERRRHYQREDGLLARS